MDLARYYLALALPFSTREETQHFEKRFHGAPGRIRTSDTWFRKPMLYPLSYRRKAWVVYRGRGGAATAIRNFRGEAFCLAPQLNRVGGQRMMLPFASW